MIVDTDVLIWLTRGNRTAADFLDRLDDIFISSITYMELLHGARNKREISVWDKTFEIFGVRMIHLDEAISIQATHFVKKHSLSHSLQLADALIAATAILHALPLATANVKHFSILKDEGLKLSPFRP